MTHGLDAIIFFIAFFAALAGLLTLLYFLEVTLDTPVDGSDVGAAYVRRIAGPSADADLSALSGGESGLDKAAPGRSPADPALGRRSARVSG